MTFKREERKKEDGVVTQKDIEEFKKQI